jgi:hypothetical protein
MEVHTSQETHYFSATKPSRLMSCEICCFHGSDYEEWHLIRCDAVWLPLEQAVCLRSALHLLLNPNFFPNSQILSTLMMEAVFSYKISVLTKATLRHIPEDDIVQH